MRRIRQCIAPKPKGKIEWHDLADPINHRLHPERSSAESRNLYLRFEIRGHGMGCNKAVTKAGRFPGLEAWNRYMRNFLKTLAFVA
jgi:hypothetical protein